ncbi:hypothetical protein ITP53_55395 [Nonomuraea sp. K274]|uniref:Uncharacterized protein n=1 Tax=Nonomuraea cypriaca TaxID=1187855 RepID=A0A931F464_9ACTN|nr:hypothetical protein [Nonomuraea cypriaca]MBF8194689.1 hypothetical protein [Nonomuraea cypriaca]
MTEHVITIRWVDAPEDVGFDDFVEGTYNSFTCTCELPLADRDAATVHAAESGQCPTCLGSGQISPNPRDTGGCQTCDGSGRTKTVTVRARVTEEFLKDMAELLPAQFGLEEVVALLEAHLPDRGADTVLPVAAGLIRYLEVRGDIVLGTAPDYVSDDGCGRAYDDPRWIRT